MPVPTASQPTVSVILATRDRRDVLDQCLAAYAEQTYPNIEIVVVDNGSVDGTSQMIQEKYPDVVLHRFPENKGPEALNLAAQKAAGRYLWRSDDDAFPDSANTLADAVVFLERFPHVTVVSGEILERLIDFQPLDYYPFSRPETMPEDGLPMVEFWGTAAMIRREAFLEVGGFWDVFYGEELDLSSRLILHGGCIRYAPWIKVRHLSAFADNRDQRTRWLLQAEMVTRYQFTYFPMLRAVGRSLVVWMGLLLAAVRHGMGLGTLFKGIRASFRGAGRGRKHHQSLSRAQLHDITFGRSIWDVVFRYYRVRWNSRKASA